MEKPIKADVSALWQIAIGALRAVGAAALEADELARKPTPKEALRIYAARKARNRHMTLKQACEDMGASYDAARQYRSRQGKRKGKQK